MEIGGFVKSVGIEFTSVDLNYAESRLKLKDSHKNIHGYGHGGLYYTMADSTAGAVVHAQGSKWVTLNASFSYLQGIQEGVLIAKATPIRFTTKTCVIDVKIYEEGTNALLCTGTFTMYKVA